MKVDCIHHSSFAGQPGFAPALRFPQIAGAIDLLPTLADLVGLDVEVDKPLDGRSFRRLLLEESPDWDPRLLFAVKRNQVSVRTQRFRLDASGRLFDIEADPGQILNVSDRHPELTAQLQQRAKRHAQTMQADFVANANRPFTVGYGVSTTLTARDGVEHGTIQRSSKAPNNSFFTHWTRADDFITWDVEIGTSGVYEAIVYYTCAAGDEGATLRIMMEGGNSVQARVVEVFDPPLYDKSKERVATSHYIVKDFNPLSLGTLRLDKGQGTLRLDAADVKGDRVIDVHSLDLIKR